MTNELQTAVSTWSLKRYKKFLGLKSVAYLNEETLAVLERLDPDIRSSVTWDDEKQCWRLES